ncbi:MAG: hypothetical protein ACYTGH_06625 [Planctomycetota bacterium]|jgi:hypothetical protein
MFTITLTMEEANEMSWILTREIKDLRSEIHHTDDRSYREKLVMRKKILEDMLARTENMEVAKTA